MYGLSFWGRDVLSQTWWLRTVSHFCSSQIDSWCKDNSYVIAGYYQANERVKDARYGLHTVGGGFEATEPSLSDLDPLWASVAKACAGRHLPPPASSGVQVTGRMSSRSCVMAPLLCRERAQKEREQQPGLPVSTSLPPPTPKLWKAGSLS